MSRQKENIISVDLQVNHHNWKKLNLITVSSKNGNYDEYKCSKCGIVGKCYNLIDIKIDINKYSIENVNNCDFMGTYANGNAIVIIKVGSKIKITVCTAVGGLFINCVHGSEHIVVDAPLPYKNDEKGVWINGFTEKVKLLNNEFNLIFE